MTQARVAFLFAVAVICAPELAGADALPPAGTRMFSVKSIRATLDRAVPNAELRPAGVVRQTPKQPDSTRNGTLIGAAVGLGYGLAVDAVISGELGTEQKIMIPITTTAVGAGIGWLIDKLR